MIDESLKQFIEAEILPQYDNFDAAHRRDHADMVIARSLELAQQCDVDENMVYAIAAYHDMGLMKDRKTHHLVSGEIVRGDARLKKWFSAEQIETMAEAVEDHRASAGHEPRSIYGRIVADSDHFINLDMAIERTVQFGLANFPELDKEGHYLRTVKHLREKYGDNGYLKLWFPKSSNALRLEGLRAVIRDENQLKAKFDEIYGKLNGTHDPEKKNINLQ